MSSSSSPLPHPPPSPPRVPPSDAEESLELSLRLATHPVRLSPSTHSISIRKDASILSLKERLYAEWDGKPKPQGITIIKGGRVCRDTELLDTVFHDELETTPRPSELVLHVVARASAWSAPFTTPPDPTPLPLLPTINTIPPSPSPSPLPEEAPQTPGYSPSYVSPIPSTSSPSPEPAPTPATSTTLPPAPPTSNNPYLVYLGHLQRLIPIQRSLLLLNLQKAHHYYQYQIELRSQRLREGNEGDEAAGEELGQVESLLKECGLWSLVVKREEQVRKEYEENREKDAAGNAEGSEEFKVVQLDGLPYLLHTPPTLTQRRSTTHPSLSLLTSLTRAQTILKILTTLLQLLITFQPTSAAIAHGRHLLSSSRPGSTSSTNLANLANQGGAAGDLAQIAALGGADLPRRIGGVPPVPGLNPLVGGRNHGGGRRAATISITLHIDSLVQFLLPLFFLSLKLGFLLFIFARHASPTKRYVLVGMAVAYVFWEGVRIARRRRGPDGVGGGVPGAAGGRDRERERDRERRRLARDLANQAQANAQQPPPQVVNQPQGPNDPMIPLPPPRAPPPLPAGAGQLGRRIPSSSTSSSTRREPPSIFSPKYWINSLAAVGLVSEARELGLSPRYIAGRPISSSQRHSGPTRPISQLSRLERLKLDFKNFGEVVWVGSVLFVATLVPEIERKRKKALEKRERLLIEKKVRWEKEREKEEREKERRNAESKATKPNGEEIGSSVEGEKGKGKEGREKVSDEALFEDGTGDAYTLASTSTSTSKTAPQASSSNSLASTSRSRLVQEHSASTSTNSPSSSIEPAVAAPSEPTPPTEVDEELSLGLDDEGDGDIAASASVSDNSDDEDGREGRPGGQQDGIAGEGVGGNEDGAVVAIF
ncbi:hypothetical protein JCM16303_004615 [Sporobolomyces ruberrimus]